jgi:TIR domain
VAVPGDADIFVSYCRADSAGTAGRLSDRLSRHFGPGQVFRDIDSIEAGEDFEQTIRLALRTASAVLIVIDPRWLDASPEDATRRIDDPLDYVRREIELALSVPLWVGWRVAGAKRTYSRLVVILLYQVAVAHLVAFLAGSMVMFGLALRSLNIVTETIHEGLKADDSAGAVYQAFQRKIEPLFVHGEVRVAFVLATPVLLAGVIWLLRCWGAYRNAFALSRWRSLAAFAISVFVGWAGSKLVGLPASSGR